MENSVNAIRLVDRDWAACAARFLFDRIHWSPQDLDIEVFEYFARRPDLAARGKSWCMMAANLITSSRSKITYGSMYANQYEDHGWV